MKYIEIVHSHKDTKHFGSVDISPLGTGANAPISTILHAQHKLPHFRKLLLESKTKRETKNLESHTHSCLFESDTNILLKSDQTSKHQNTLTTISVLCEWRHNCERGINYLA